MGHLDLYVARAIADERTTDIIRTADRRRLARERNAGQPGLHGQGGQLGQLVGRLVDRLHLSQPQRHAVLR